MLFPSSYFFKLKTLQRSVIFPFEETRLFLKDTRDRLLFGKAKDKERHAQQQGGNEVFTPGELYIMPSGPNPPPTSFSRPCIFEQRQKKPPHHPCRGFSVLEAGVEPATNSLGNCCSIQLSYPSDSFPCFLFRTKQERRKISTFTHRSASRPDRRSKKTTKTAQI